MGQSVQQRARQAFAAHHFGPLFEWQIRRDDHARSLVGPADHIKEQFGSRLGKGHVAQFVEDQQVVAFELSLETLEPALFTLFEELGDQ